MKRYKYVRPNPNDPDIADELHFTCAGFVEYCYEQAKEDIINDPPCFANHENNDCQRSSVPLYYDPENMELIHRLYPGYLMKAFEEVPRSVARCPRPSHNTVTLHRYCWQRAWRYRDRSPDALF